MNWRLHRQRWINGDMPDEQSTSHLDDDVASNVIANMKHWQPFDESGGGDLMCIDCSNGRIVEFEAERIAEALRKCFGTSSEPCFAASAEAAL